MCCFSLYFQQNIQTKGIFNALCIGVWCAALCFIPLVSLFFGHPRSVRFLTLATRDLVTSATMAFAGRDEATIAKEKADWRALADAFWRKQAGENTLEDAGKKKKLERTKVYEWLVATWTLLVSATGMGWSQFVVSKAVEDRPHPTAWKSLTLSIDQGGDGLSAPQMDGTRGRTDIIAVLICSRIDDF